MTKGCQRAPLVNSPNHHPLGSTAMLPGLRRTLIMNVHLGKSKRNGNGWCRVGFKKKKKKAASVTADTNSVTYIRDLSGGSRRNSPAFLGFTNHPYNVRSLSCWLQNVYIGIKTEKSFGKKKINTEDLPYNKIWQLGKAASDMKTKFNSLLTCFPKTDCFGPPVETLPCNTRWLGSHSMLKHKSWLDAKTPNCVWLFY